MQGCARILVIGVLGIGYSTAGATNAAEVEPNNSKIQATPTTNVPGWGVAGDTIGGTTIGANMSAGAASLDMFFVQLAPTTTNIYRHRLVITTDGSTGHTGAIMGLPQDGTPSDLITAQVTSPATSPPRFNQWYGFGRGDQFYYRVTGTPNTTQPYVATLETTTVTPVQVGTYQAGQIRLSTRDSGHTTNTQLFLYDAALNLLRWNDDAPAPATDTQSEITIDLPAGTYYLAISTANTAIGQEHDALDRATSGTRLDFPGGLARESSSNTPVDVAFSISDLVGTSPHAATLTESYEIYWATFDVTGNTGACCLPDQSCVLRTASSCNSAGGLYQGDNIACVSTAVYTATPNVEIPDMQQVTDQLIVPDTRVISDLSVGLQIPHTFQGDISATLTSPQGTTVEILSRPGRRSDDFGFSADNFGNVATDTDFVLRDEADFFYGLGSSGAPATNVTGAWRTDRGLLAAFNGEDALGTWTLTVSDNAPGDSGTLVRWRLFVSSANDQVCAPSDPCESQVRGDLNCDGLLNNFDINCFVIALSGGEEEWGPLCNANGNCGYLCVADISGDGRVNNFDIDPFVACLANGCP